MWRAPRGREPGSRSISLLPDDPSPRDHQVSVDVADAVAAPLAASILDDFLPRLAHSMQEAVKKIARYQAVVPTTWNASPKDDRGAPGPIERAIVEEASPDGEKAEYP